MFFSPFLNKQVCVQERESDFQHYNEIPEAINLFLKMFILTHDFWSSLSKIQQTHCFRPLRSVLGSREHVVRQTAHLVAREKRGEKRRGPGPQFPSRVRPSDPRTFHRPFLPRGPQHFPNGTTLRTKPLACGPLGDIYHPNLAICYHMSIGSAFSCFNKQRLIFLT